MPCTKCFEKGFVCGVEEKVWGASRQALDGSDDGVQNANGLVGSPDHEDMDVEEIPRAVAKPDSEYINPVDGVLLQSFWPELLCDEDLDDPHRAWGIYLLNRFGPNISSKAVRHAILSVVAKDSQKTFGLDDSSSEHFGLSLRYVQQAINERDYIEVLYASFWLSFYSVDASPYDEESPVEDTAR